MKLLCVLIVFMVFVANVSRAGLLEVQNLLAAPYADVERSEALHAYLASTNDEVSIKRIAAGFVSARNAASAVGSLSDCNWYTSKTLALLGTSWEDCSGLWQCDLDSNAHKPLQAQMVGQILCLYQICLDFQNESKPAASCRQIAFVSPDGRVAITILDAVAIENRIFVVFKESASLGENSKAVRAFYVIVARFSPVNGEPRLDALWPITRGDEVFLND